MAKELHKAGVLPEDFSGQQLESTRVQYLSALDLASQKIATRLLNDQSAFIDDGSDIFDRSNAISSTLEMSRSRAFDLEQFSVPDVNVSHIFSSHMLIMRAELTLRYCVTKRETMLS